MELSKDQALAPEVGLATARRSPPETARPSSAGGWGGPGGTVPHPSRSACSYSGGGPRHPRVIASPSHSVLSIVISEENEPGQTASLAVGVIPETPGAIRYAPTGWKRKTAGTSAISNRSAAW